MVVKVMLLVICLFQVYQWRVHHLAIVPEVPTSSVVEYCTWDRGNHTLQVDRSQTKVIAETVSILGKSEEGCR